MSLFMLGVLTAVLPSVVALAWLVWRADANDAPRRKVHNTQFPISNRLQ